MHHFVQYLESPAGLLEISADADFLKQVSFVEAMRFDNKNNPVTEQTVNQLQEYFLRKRLIFELPLSPDGTEFYNKVWHELLNIPFGKTISYLELARRLGDEKVIRAAASANGKNPVAIIIPCHRVIGSNGSLTGYAGGLWRKQWLLDFESGNYRMEGM